MLQPKRTKFRKMHKMPMKGLAYRGSQLAFGSFGIKAEAVHGLPLDRLNLLELQ